MKCLVLDTALSACSAALVDGDTVRSNRFEAMQKGHAEALLPMIDEVLAEAGCSYKDLDRLAVTVGPGAFTGLRIGLSTARGLAVALDLPLAGVTTLEALAVAAANAEPSDQDIAVAIDARRGQVYFQIFAPDLTPRGPAEAITPDAAADLLNKQLKPVRIVGTGADLIEADHLDRKLSDLIVLPNAASFAAHVAQESYPCNKGVSPSASLLTRA